MSKLRNRFLRFSFIIIIFNSYLFGMDFNEVAKIGNYIVKNSQKSLGRKLQQNIKKERFSGVLYKHLKCINEIGKYCLYKQGRKQYLLKKKDILKKYLEYNNLVKSYKLAIQKWQKNKEKRVYNYKLDICGNLGYFYPFQNPSDCYKLLDLSTKVEKTNIENYLFKQLKE